MQYISGPYKTTQIAAALLLPRRRRVDDAQVLGQSSSTAAPHNVLIQRNLSCVPGALLLRHQGTYCDGRSSQVQLLVQSFYPLCTAAHVLRLMYCGKLNLKVALAQYTSRSTRGIKEYLVYCGFCTAAGVLRQPQYPSCGYRSLPW